MRNQNNSVFISYSMHQTTFCVSCIKFVHNQHFVGEEYCIPWQLYSFCGCFLPTIFCLFSHCTVFNLFVKYHFLSNIGLKE